MKIPVAEICIVFIIFCVLCSLYARYVEPNLLVVKKIKIKNSAIKPIKPIKTIKPIKIVVLSDFHYPRYCSFEMIRRAIKKSNEFKPDIVFILGDFFDKNKYDPAILPENIDILFENIYNRHGIYGVLGNHDHWFDEKAIRVALQSKTQIKLIDNQSVCIDTPDMFFYIAGVGDLWSNNVDYSSAVIGIPEKAPIILLSHNPDVVDEINDSRIVIQFSGHTHGGQIRFPLIGAIRVPSKFGNKYSKGAIKTKNHVLYVNSGICSMKNIRFMCPPEVTWVEIA